MKTLALLALLSLSAQAIDAPAIDERLVRGQALHDTICRGCHEDDMYTKRHLSRNPYFDLRMQTRLWSEVVKEKWSSAEIDDVVYFLQNTYYKQ
jgi:mono/diheme cytochrome c family protein